MTVSRIEAGLPSTDSGSRLSASEEAREFYQGRLALFGKIGFLFTFGYFALTNAFLVAFGEETLVAVFSSTPNLCSLANTANAGAVWLVCRQGGRIPAGWLRALDIYAVVSYSSIVTLHAWLATDDPYAVFGSIMPVTYCVLARAVIVPSATVRTLWISVLSYLPLFVVAGATSGAGATAGSGGAPAFSLSTFIIRGLVGAALASVVSHVIYGLRRQVSKARQLGQYRLEEKIGEGGMGAVYRASHAMLRRPTAVKLLRPELAGDRPVARFEREVQLTSQLTHPNTVAIYDYGRTPDGLFYYAMEFLDGLNLDELVVRHGPQAPGRVVWVLAQVCASLAEAHEIGLVHRDVKPANVILCERGGAFDIVKVVDFGLVKHVDGQAPAAVLTGAHTIAGTPLYMAPEAIRSPEEVDARSDLYSIGAIGYFLLTGRNLFERSTVMDVVSDQLSLAPEAPSKRLGRELPRDLEELVLRCLEKDPESRPQSSRELREAFLECSAVGEWSEVEARRWWEAEAAGGKGGGPPRPPGVSAEAETAPFSASAPTLAIDLEKR